MPAVRCFALVFMLAGLASRAPAQGYGFTTLAGVPPEINSGSADGTGSSAMCNSPKALAPGSYAAQVGGGGGATGVA